MKQAVFMRMLCLQGFLPSSQRQPSEETRLLESVTGQPNYLDIQRSPFNEYSTSNLASLAFPTLFPDTKGDPTSDEVVRQISEKATESFAQKLKHLIKFGERKDGKWIFRFASHPRFGYWAYNMLYRKILLAQGNFYIKQNLGENIPTVDELKEMLESNNYSQLINKIQYYAKNISGTNSYWYQIKEQLKATLQQHGAPTSFWTLSCAEFHWPEFHALFGEVDHNISNYRENVVKNPHILDWFFTERTEAFVKHWLYNILDAKWHWYRYEFSVLRGGIHCHGLAKLNSDPDLCDLASNAVTAKQVLKMHKEQSFAYTESDLTLLKEGATAEKSICSYYDYLVSCMNPTQLNDWEKPLIHPCQKTFDNVLLNFDEDYVDLINTVQRHSKCNSAYCLKQDKDGNQHCRFHYPIPLNDETHIKYEVCSNGVDYRPEIVAKRNDERINRHQQLQLQGWRANCDIQLIIDHHACVEYLAKYASKAEKMPSVARDAFVNVISNLKEDTSPTGVIRKLMMKCVGERDMGIQEVMHQILSLKLYRSSFQVITISLENTKRCMFTSTDIIAEKSDMEKYSQRTNKLGSVNLIDFFSKYEDKSSKLQVRTKPVVVRTVPNYSSNPAGLNYELYCKFQLLKFKPWSHSSENAWDNEQEVDGLYVSKWKEFLETDLGVRSVPNWKRLLEDTNRYDQNDETDNDVHETTPEQQCEEWMYIARMIGPDRPALPIFSHQQIEDMRSRYTPEQIGSLPFWLESSIKNNTLQTQIIDPVDVSVFNEKQRFAYNIVKDHYLQQRHDDQL